jgi:hypothetical protein
MAYRHFKLTRYREHPSDLRRRSAADHVLGLRVRIPPSQGCFSVVSVVRCQVKVSATGRFLVQRSPTDCVVSLCVIKCNNRSTPNHD